MTLIAAFSAHQYPVLFGDLLTTGPTNQPITVTPAAGDIDGFSEGFDWHITGLQQKVTLVATNCAIAWAGSWLGARIAIAALRQMAGVNRRLEYDAVLAYLHAEPDLKRHETCFVGLLAMNGAVRMFHFGATELTTPSLGLTFYSGSGSEAILEYSDYLAKARLHQVESPASPLQMAAGIATQLTSLLVRSEHYGGDTGPTLFRRFGGAYEVAYCGGKETIVKTPELTYVFWRAGVNHQGRTDVSIPEFVMRQAYAGEHLTIRCVRLRQLEDGSLEKVDDHRHIVAPMFESVPIDAWAIGNSMTLQSALVCHCISVNDPEQKTRHATILRQEAPSETDPWIRISEDQGRVAVTIRHELLLEIAKLAAAFR